MKKNKFVLAALLSVAMLSACGGSSETTSLRTKLDAPTDLTFDLEAGTFSFKAVANATYYRVYFHDLTAPTDEYATDSPNEYYVTHLETREVPGAFPGAEATEQEVYVYDTDESGNKILKSDEEILSCTPAYSKRYSATYLDADENKQYYEAGETTTFELPNDSIGGGTYLIGVKSGGPIALYSNSDFLAQHATLVLHNVDPEITSNDFSFDFNQYGTTTTTTNMGGMSMESHSVDTTNEVLNGEGMMFEISNADSYYSANPDTTLSYTIADASGASVSFDYTDVRMYRNDSNTFCGWDLIKTEDGVTTGSAGVSNFVYAHQGPTMKYASGGYFYVEGLTEGTEYTLKIKANGDGGTSSYDSSEVEYNFTFAKTAWTASSNQGGGEGGGFPGGGEGGGFPGGDTSSEGGDSESTPEEGDSTSSEGAAA